MACIIVRAGFCISVLTKLSVAELSSSLQGDSEMLLKRWLSGFREPVCIHTCNRLESIT